MGRGGGGPRPPPPAGSAASPPLTPSERLAQARTKRAAADQVASKPDNSEIVCGFTYEQGIDCMTDLLIDMIDRECCTVLVRDEDILGSAIDIAKFVLYKELPENIDPRSCQHKRLWDALAGLNVPRALLRAFSTHAKDSKARFSKDQEEVDLCKKRAIAGNFQKVAAKPSASGKAKAAEARAASQKSASTEKGASLKGNPESYAQYFLKCLGVIYNQNDTAQAQTYKLASSLNPKTQTGVLAFMKRVQVHCSDGPNADTLLPLFKRLLKCAGKILRGRETLEANHGLSNATGFVAFILLQMRAPQLLGVHDYSSRTTQAPCNSAAVLADEEDLDEIALLSFDDTPPAELPPSAEDEDGGDDGYDDQHDQDQAEDEAQLQAALDAAADDGYYQGEEDDH